ncbi:MAG: response regulator [Myxococcota bacterium]|nr:response regulator [Myxococcota bacterium]
MDDFPESAAFTAEYLEAHGYDCRVALTGREALDIAAGFRPDIAIIDCGLPDIDGREVARTLCCAGADRPYLIALTGSGSDEDRALALAAGFDQFAVKPLKLAALMALLPGADESVPRRSLEIGE